MFHLILFLLYVCGPTGPDPLPPVEGPNGSGPRCIQ